MYHECKCGFKGNVPPNDENCPGCGNPLNGQATLSPQEPSLPLPVEETPRSVSIEHRGGTHYYCPKCDRPFDVEGGEPVLCPQCGANNLK